MNSTEVDLKEQPNMFIAENAWLKEEAIQRESEVFNLRKELNSVWWDAVLQSDVE